MPLELSVVDRLEAAMRERLLVKGHGGTRNELEVRREPLRYRVPQRVVGGDRLVGKLRPSFWLVLCVSSQRSMLARS